MFEIWYHFAKVKNGDDAFTPQITGLVSAFISLLLPNDTVEKFFSEISVITPNFGVTF